MQRTLGLVLALGALPATGWAGDLGAAIDFVDGAIGPEAVSEYDEYRDPNEHRALGMLTARNVDPSRPLDDYRCDETAIDGEYTLRTSGEEGWGHRACRELRFRRDDLPGYQTMGPPPLYPRELDPILEQVERETDVPAKLLEAIIRFQSGRRPGLVSDDGRFGLMQLKPELLRQQGISPTNLLDPLTNVRKGAMYVRKLTFQFKGLKMALAAYLHGPGAVARAGDIPNDPESLFFVRSVFKLYYASIREVPKGIAAEAMTFVWTWLE